MKPVGYWTKENCAKEALKYTRLKDFYPTSAYVVARGKGWLPDITGHLIRKYRPIGYLTKDTCAIAAKRYSYRTEFFEGALSEYLTALRRGWLDEICMHMKTKAGASKNDMVYLWEAKGLYFNGEQVYKIGITSCELVRKRINYCAIAAKVKAKIVFARWVGEGRAREVEKTILAYGHNPKYEGFNGCTEFRALSAEELRIVTAIAEEATLL